MSRVGYMCAVDYTHELGEALGGTKIYATVEDIKHHRKCVKNCGIMKVEITKLELVEVGCSQWGITEEKK